jgi:shikimate kinase
MTILALTTGASTILAAIIAATGTILAVLISVRRKVQAVEIKVNGRLDEALNEIKTLAGELATAKTAPAEKPGEAADGLAN